MDGEAEVEDDFGRAYAYLEGEFLVQVASHSMNLGSHLHV